MLHMCMCVHVHVHVHVHVQPCDCKALALLATGERVGRSHRGSSAQQQPHGRRGARHDLEQSGDGPVANRRRRLHCSLPADAAARVAPRAARAATLAAAALAAAADSAAALTSALTAASVTARAAAGAPDARATAPAAAALRTAGCNRRSSPRCGPRRRPWCGWRRDGAMRVALRSVLEVAPPSQSRDQARPRGAGPEWGHELLFANLANENAPAEP